VSDLLESLTIEEMEDWQAFFSLEPWGFRVENHRAGVITATLANFIGRLTEHNALKPSDIFPERTISQSLATPSVESMRMLSQSLKMLNGK